MLQYNLLSPSSGTRVTGVLIAVVAIAAIGWAIWQSKREDEGTEGLEK